uniref:Uncharacterized protein n=1 Tax=Arundo donax TaxID=35708 RepID=A0A0A9CD57_ARUDO
MDSSQILHQCHPHVARLVACSVVAIFNVYVV